MMRKSCFSLLLPSSASPLSVTSTSPSSTTLSHPREQNCLSKGALHYSCSSRQEEKTATIVTKSSATLSSISSSTPLPSSLPHSPLPSHCLQSSLTRLLTSWTTSHLPLRAHKVQQLFLHHQLFLPHLFSKILRPSPSTFSPSAHQPLSQHLSHIRVSTHSL